MIKLTIWGRPNSSNVAKVMWAVAELGVPCRRIDIGGPFGGTRDPVYRKLNPNGTIPTLEDDGFALWESNAIVRYLAARYGAGTLCPADDQARAGADRWMDWASTTVAPAMDRLRSAYRKPAEARDEAEIQAALQATADVWAIADEAVAEDGFMAGPLLTMADIALGPLLHRWHLVPLDRPALPRLTALYDRLLAREAFAEHVAKAVS
jgi:glutathione S-transferase